MNIKTLLILSAYASLTFINPAYASSWWDNAKHDAQKKIDSMKSETRDTNSEHNSSDINKAFKQALNNASDTVISKLGNTNGFNNDPLIHIPLPKSLEKPGKLLKKAGKSQYVDNLELKLNRAAEAATPKVKHLFKKSIRDLSFRDVRRIYNGPDDSATQYFKSNMSASLKAEITPVIKSSLSSVGAVNAYNKLVKKYNKLPFTKDIQPDITEHVTNKTIKGIFYYIAKEEAAIRNDPVKQTTDLLKRIFGKTQ